jgi:hypothetical protein
MDYVPGICILVLGCMFALHVILRKVSPGQSGAIIITIALIAYFWLPPISWILGGAVTAFILLAVAFRLGADWQLARLRPR